MQYDGLFFPAIYLPQAVGLLVGRTFGLAVETSYRLSRVLALATAVAIIFAAFSIYPPSPAAVALLFIPMSLFQFASASIDGITLALAILSVSIFLRLLSSPVTNRMLFWVLVVCLTVLITARMNMFPLFVLALYAAWRRPTKEAVAAISMSAACIMGWIMVAMSTVTNTVAIGTQSVGSTALWYAVRPLEFGRLVLVTLFGLDGKLGYYVESFFGLLGWLDAPFSPHVLRPVIILFCALVFLSLCRRSKENPHIKFERAALALSSAGTVLLVFFLMLVTWSKHPAEIIEGVQGRYFISAMVPLAYAVSCGADAFRGARGICTILLLGALLTYSLMVTGQLIVSRYYLPA